MSEAPEKSRSYVTREGTLVVKTGFIPKVHSSIRAHVPGITWILVFSVLGLLMVQLINLVAIYHLTSNPDTANQAAPLLFVVWAIGVIQLIIVVVIFLSFKSVNPLNKFSKPENFDLSLKDH